jgi:hypothetical protein
MQDDDKNDPDINDDSQQPFTHYGPKPKSIRRTPRFHNNSNEDNANNLLGPTD